MVSKTKDLSSSLSRATMKSFKYNGKLYNPKNPEKKLKQLGITWDDVEIVEKEDKTKTIEYEDPNRLYYFINKTTGYSISSIYPECNKEGYEPTTLGYLESYWNKNGKLS